MPWRSRGALVEMLLSGAVLIGVVYVIAHVLLYRYLPPPFFFEPSDTFADWFNPAFWSRQEGAYDTWRTIYPPLTFIILRALSFDRCYPRSRDFEGSAGLVARDCDWLGIVLLVAMFIGNIVLTWKTFRKIDPATAPMRTIGLGLGVPMMIALERGNLLLLAYACVILAVGPLVASARLRWFFAAIAINLKIYLIAVFVPLLLKRRWLWVEGVLVATLLVYLLSLAAFGHGTPWEIARNVLDFSNSQAVTILDPWSAFTYQPLISVIEAGILPLGSIIGSDWVRVLEILLPTVTLITQAAIGMAALAVWARPDLYTSHRAAFLGVMMALVSSESGHYTLIFVALFVFMEPWRGFGRKWAIVMTYVLAIPYDIPIDVLPEGARNLYFKDTTLPIANVVTLGPFVRPLLSMTIAWALCLTTLGEWRRATFPAGFPFQRLFRSWQSRRTALSDNPNSREITD